MGLLFQLGINYNLPRALCADYFFYSEGSLYGVQAAMLVLGIDRNLAIGAPLWLFFIILIIIFDYQLFSTAFMLKLIYFKYNYRYNKVSRISYLTCMTSIPILVEIIVVGINALYNISEEARNDGIVVEYYFFKSNSQ